MITTKSERKWYEESTARKAGKAKTIEEWMKDREVTVRELSDFMGKTDEETKELIKNPLNGKVTEVLSMCHALDIKLEEIKTN